MQHERPIRRLVDGPAARAPPLYFAASPAGHRAAPPRIIAVRPSGAPLALRPGSAAPPLRSRAASVGAGSVIRVGCRGGGLGGGAGAGCGLSESSVRVTRIATLRRSACFARPWERSDADSERGAGSGVGRGAWPLARLRVGLPSWCTNLSSGTGMFKFRSRVKTLSARH